MLRFKFRSIAVANLRHLIPLLAATALVLSPAALQADLGDQLFKLLPDDGAPDDSFGYSVAIGGTAAIVGARSDDNGLLSGSAYLFDTTTGQQIAKLLPDDGAADDRFGFSVAISGATAIVGAYRDDDNGIDSGSAYLFDITTGQQIAKLLPIDGAAGERFGTSVAISSTTAIVGAGHGNDNGYWSGSAYMFDATTGQQIAKLLPNDGAADDLFGISVAISSTIAIVGAVYDDDHGISSGSAYLFDTTTGQQIAKLVPDDGAAGDFFGWSVAINGTTGIVGAVYDDDNGTSSGSAYLFGAETGQQIVKLLAKDGSAADYFGRSVAISGSTGIVGAYGDNDNDNGSNAGSAYLFDTTTGQQITKLLPDDGAAGDMFGYHVAMSGETVLVGARYDDDNGTDSGSAYLFDAGGASACPWDLNGDGTVGAFDLALLLGDWGPCADPDNCPEDLDGNGEVGAFDLALLLGNWGPCP